MARCVGGPGARDTMSCVTVKTHHRLLAAGRSAVGLIMTVSCPYYGRILITALGFGLAVLFFRFNNTSVCVLVGDG